MKQAKYYFYSLRPRQWFKNLFVVLPIVFARHLTDPQSLYVILGAFLCFCAAASGVYLFNDMVDLESDKAHPTKKLRPLASGKISKKVAFVLCGCLMVSSVLMSFSLQKSFGSVLLTYLVLNILYSYWLKHFLILDVLALGLFFVLRVLGGAVVLEVEISHWLIICAGTLALFLGFTKRRQDLLVLGAHGLGVSGRKETYSGQLIDQAIAVSTTSTVVFYTLYTVDAVTVSRFGTRDLLLTIPFVYYGIFRYLYLIYKKRAEGDPTRLVLSDPKLTANLLIWLVVVIGIVYFHFPHFFP